MARMRRRFAVLACIVGAVTLAIGIGVATGAKLKQKSKPFEVPADGSAQGVVKCKRGAEAISGGFAVDVTQAAAQEFERKGKRKWRVVATSFGDTASEATANAYCAEPPFDLKAKSQSGTISEDFDTIAARCPRGREAISGGFRISPAGSATATTSKRADKRTWVVSLFTEGPPYQATAIVYCDKRERSLKTKSRTETLDQGEGISESVAAKCRRSQRAVSGGFEGEINSVDFELTFPNASFRRGKRSWQATGLPVTVNPSELTAYVYCEKKKNA